MVLPEGKTCGDCVHFRHCSGLFGHKVSDTYCDWFPRRFYAKFAVGETVTTIDGVPQGIVFKVSRPTSVEVEIYDVRWEDGTEEFGIPAEWLRHGK